ncbi:MAG: iron chelate uptake ABC transporter family permease subunit [Dehalococcoidales bacterium]|jgi:iron complex transport system permease protein|nr:iron chelate uptake ABC transporter family permease subunit [Dehalococcoidales bacterium]MDP7109641.1 iron chelate uptake ABC transporter family permease subunit [Dehalococcoidales bacterium]MDP7310052.1 iron chelate uptake ABC transporter family permease subunit [Dehalococcoidales bacterium]MDP7409574.1 iron chelate uptake ABC transporter family permease subunit [Dehalococcoidales bacterium]MDP7675908.1 iron chelate uptake ABC transporter family permease subunit [Dehalococcoidales bacterium
MPTKSKNSKRLLGISLTLGGGLILSVFLATALGAVNVSLPDIFRMSLNKIALFDFPATWRTVDETIIFQIRLPRVVGGALVGAALATAGVLFQGLLRNPLADPYIIGTSAGAALGATIAMILPLNLALLGFGLIPLTAFIGALTSVILVYNLARVGGRTPVISMLLTGFVVSALFVAIIAFMMSIGDRLGLNLRSVFSFLMGHISVTNWNQLAVVAPLVIGGIIAARFFAFHLNAFSLGEEGAAYLGIEVERDKILILSLGSLLTATAVSISGLVGFVGLVMPHAVRLSLGPDHRLLIPASALAGAIFLVITDLLARTILAPGEIPVGIITALIGAPFFLYLLRRSRREYAF